MWASPAVAQAGDRYLIGLGHASSPVLPSPNGGGDSRAFRCPRQTRRRGIRGRVPNGPATCGLAGCADNDAVEAAPAPEHSESESGQRPFVDWLKAYNYEEKTSDGMLRIQPLTRAMIPRVARLLEETFADTLGYRKMFRWWLRMQAENYLAVCLDCLPAGAVLVATIVPNDEFQKQHENDTGRSALQDTVVESSKFQGFDSSQFKPNLDTSRGQQRGRPSPFIPFGMQPKGFWKDDGKKKDKIFQGFRDDLDVLGEKYPMDSAQLDATTYAESSVEMKEGVFNGFQKESVGDSVEDSLADIGNRDENTATGSEVPELQHLIAIEGTSAEAGEEAGEEAETKREDPAIVDGGGAAEQPCRDQETILLGTVEVSLDSSTRPFFWFLNPPEDSAFISNMAVDPSYRRQGHGMRLLKAVEEVARRGGNPDTCLHVRFEDTAAISLYQQAGYLKADEHNFLWSAAGFDRKALLRKDL